MIANGIIFSNLHDKNISELTVDRTMASVPFLCRHRLVDFPISNMANAGILDISVVAHNNYYTLMEHIGSGKDWDLARRRGGIRLLTPYVKAQSGHTSLYPSRLEALIGISESVADMDCDYVVMADCDFICNIDIKDMLRAHEASGAQVTLAVKRMRVDREQARKSLLVSSDEEGRITDLVANPMDFSGETDVCINVYVVNRQFLQTAVAAGAAHGFSSFTHNILQPTLKKENYRIYRFEGFTCAINSMTDYYNSSMAVLGDADARADLFGIHRRPILTHVRNSAPTVHTGTASVKNSLLADGCVIEGRVENSILFRGVHVGKGAVVKNSILFSGAYVGRDAELNCVVADKDVLVNDGVRLSGHETLPFYIDKNRHI